VTIPENVDAIHSMILDNWKITTKKIAVNLVITRERVGYIIHESLGMRTLSAKWFPNVSMLVRSVIECCFTSHFVPI
jgi:hypothetical protein